MVVGGYWNKYIPVSVFSLCFNNYGKIHLYLIHDLADENEIYKIVNQFNCEVTFINIDDIYSKYFTSEINVDERFTKFTNIRLCIPKLCFEDKVLYFDSDAIVNGPLDDLFAIDLGNYFCAGCTDTGIMPGYKTQLCMKEESNYFNAGIMLLNLKRINQLELSDDWLHMINTQSFLGHDQDVFNITMGHNSLVLDNTYNSCVSTQLVDNAKIIHYAGVKNPWVYNLPQHEVWEFWEREYNKWHSSKL